MPDQQLTDAQKEAVRRYVRRFIGGWGAAIGVASIVTLLGIYYFLVKATADKAISEAQAQFRSEIDAAKKNISETEAYILQRRGAISKSDEEYKADYAKAKDDLRKLDALLKGEGKDTAVVIQKIVNELNIETLRTEVRNIKAKTIDDELSGLWMWEDNQTQRNEWIIIAQNGKSILILFDLFAAAEQRSDLSNSNGQLYPSYSRVYIRHGIQTGSSTFSVFLGDDFEGKQSKDWQFGRGNLGNKSFSDSRLRLYDTQRKKMYIRKESW
jgi:F0F1-type ATP synthase membrane subunit b/b'